MSMQSELDTVDSAIRRILIVLAKYPELGKVKTRLARSIGAAAAFQLYRAFLADLIPIFTPYTGLLPYDVRWLYVPNSPKFEKMIKEFYPVSSIDGVSFVGHPTPGLAEQQRKQLQWALDFGYHQVMIVTTDTPHLSQSIIENAFKQLSSHDIVIGPTIDGGYYLLGVRDHWDIIGNTEMSTDHVASDIIKNAQLAHLSVCILNQMMDVDTKEDLEAFIGLLQHDRGIACSNTRFALKTLGLMT